MLNEIKGFITNLGKYNEGELIGKWIEFPIYEDELADVLKEIGISDKPDENGIIYDEFFFSDFESPVEFGEYTPIKEINAFAEEWEGLEEQEQEVFKCLVENCYDIDESFEIIKNNDYFIYDDCYDMGDVAYEYIEGSGLLDNCDDVIARYFDYDKFGRDLEIDGNFYEMSFGQYIEILY